MSVSVATTPIRAQLNSLTSLGSTQVTETTRSVPPRVNEDRGDWGRTEFGSRGGWNISATGVSPGKATTSYSTAGAVAQFIPSDYWREPIRFTVDDSVGHLLTDRVRAVLMGLEPILVDTAQKNYMPVSKVEISGFVDPEDNKGEVVVTQWVDVNTDEALSYWESLGLAVERWTASLSPALADIVVGRIAIEVRSTPGGR